jgi:uncharacterized RDD family membrane protein YckC
VAGIGTRFVAALWDHLIIGVAEVLVTLAMFFVFMSVGLSTAMSGSGDMGPAYFVLALLVIVNFLIFWGYFALFEIVWNGQTPGKRAGRLRVIRRDGQPVGAGEVMVRNLVRIIDFMPGFYGIGLTTIFIDPQARRLGDMAANTIVVREGEQTRLRDVRVPTTDVDTVQVAPAAQSLYDYGYKPNPAVGGYSPDTYTPQETAPVQRYDPLPGISLRDVTPDDYRLIRELLQRVSRGEMSRDRANDLADRLAYGVAARMGQDFHQWRGRGWDSLAFLQSVLIAKEARD